MREVFRKRTLPAWPPFSVTSVPVGSSKKVFRGWIPPPSNCSSAGPGYLKPTSSGTSASRAPPVPRIARAGTFSTAAWPVATPWWWWPSTASAGAGRTPSGPSASCGTRCSRPGWRSRNFSPSSGGRRRGWIGPASRERRWGRPGSSGPNGSYRSHAIWGLYNLSHRIYHRW